MITGVKIVSFTTALSVFSILTRRPTTGLVVPFLDGNGPRLIGMDVGVLRTIPFIRRWKK